MPFPQSTEKHLTPEYCQHFAGKWFSCALSSAPILTIAGGCITCRDEWCWRMRLRTWLGRVAALGPCWTECEVWWRPQPSGLEPRQGHPGNRGFLIPVPRFGKPPSFLILQHHWSCSTYDGSIWSDRNISFNKNKSCAEVAEINSKQESSLWNCEKQNGYAPVLLSYLKLSKS